MAYQPPAKKTEYEDVLVTGPSWWSLFFAVLVANLLTGLLFFRIYGPLTVVIQK